jgi:hypothetical protein
MDTFWPSGFELRRIIRWEMNSVLVASGRPFPYRADVGEGFGMRDRAATHQIRYRPTTSKSGRGPREFRAHSS